MFVNVWTILLLACIASFPAVSAPLQAGVARVDLTPPLEMKAALGGYGERMSRPAIGIHDRVWAKALVLRQGDRRHALVTADVLAFPPGLRQAVVDKLAADEWQADQLLLLPSHAHTSLDLTALNPKNTFKIPQLGLFHKELYDRTVAKLAEVIQAAASNPVSVAAGSITKGLDGWNRNRRRGPAVDRDLTLTRFDTEAGKALAVLVNWTAHPTFMSAKHMEFSGDWPGHLQRTLEALIGEGVTVLYYNGAEGDQSPTPRSNGGPAWEQAERYGRELAIEAWRAWQETKTQPSPALTSHIEPIKLPQRRAHPDFMKTGGKEYGMTEENVGLLLERMCPPETHCAALRIGELVIAGVPGEMAADLGLEVKAAARTETGARHVAIGGLANEWISYMLSPDEYRKGGYEASVSFYGETLGPEIVRAAIRAATNVR
jgi:neutral ceramidase